MKNIIHLTTVHARTDTRIRVKQTSSLAKNINAKVFLFVQDGKGPESDETSRLQVVDTGPKLSSRVLRMTLGSWRMLRAVQKALPDVAHFHDPELIPVGLILKLFGIKVIYDVHEDVPKQIEGKFYLPLIFREPIAWAMKAVERVAGLCFDAIVPATPEIAKRFPEKKTVVVQNFPVLEEFVASESVFYDRRPPHFAYIGGITKARGAKEMVEAIDRVTSSKAKIRLAGAFSPQNFQSEMEALPGWEKVDFLGWFDRNQVAHLLGSVRAGLVILHPTARYPESYPVKMFEYMAAGLPVIASDFPLWRKIIGESKCGLLIDPLCPEEIAEAMQWILVHPSEAEAMGERAKHAVKCKSNWDREKYKLLAKYYEIV